MKKPAIPALGALSGVLAPLAPILEPMRENIEILAGRRRNRLRRVAAVKLEAAGAAPTKAEFDRLAALVVEQAETINRLIERLDGE